MPRRGGHSRGARHGGGRGRRYYYSSYRPGPWYNWPYDYYGYYYPSYFGAHAISNSEAEEIKATQKEIQENDSTQTMMLFAIIALLLAFLVMRRSK